MQHYLTNMYVLTVNHDCEDEMLEEIRQLWVDQMMGNDFFYYHYCIDNPNYPTIRKFLIDRGIKECLIHYWW